MYQPPLLENPGSTPACACCDWNWYCKIRTIGIHTTTNIGTYFDYNNYITFISIHTKIGTHIKGSCNHATGSRIKLLMQLFKCSCFHFYLQLYASYPARLKQIRNNNNKKKRKLVLSTLHWPETIPCTYPLMRVCGNNCNNCIHCAVKIFCSVHMNLPCIVLKWYYLTYQPSVFFLAFSRSTVNWWPVIKALPFLPDSFVEQTFTLTWLWQRTTFQTLHVSLPCIHCYWLILYLAIDDY